MFTNLAKKKLIDPNILGVLLPSTTISMKMFCIAVEIKPIIADFRPISRIITLILPPRVGALWPSPT